MWNVANAVPGIEGKRYLELGIYFGTNRDLVNAKERLSVDILPEGNPSYHGTTDEYFAQLKPSEKVDVVYIDACHDYGYVWRDFNNVIDHLNPDGVIMCHDMVPADESNVHPNLSGDAYKLCSLIAKELVGYTNWYLLTRDCGLAVFIDPPHVNEELFHAYKSFSYQDHMQMVAELVRTKRASDSYDDLYAFLKTVK